MVAPIPFASTVYFCAEAIMLAGAEHQKQWTLPKIASGEWTGCFATSEGPGAVTPASIKCVVKDGKLSGTKIPVTDGDCATFALVSRQRKRQARLLCGEFERCRDVTRETLKDSRSRPAGLPSWCSTARAPGRSALRAKASRSWSRVFDRAAVYLAFEQVGGADKSP